MIRARADRRHRDRQVDALRGSRSSACPVIDADRLAREAVAPGSPGLRAVVERFGPAVCAGRHARPRALGRIVFGGPRRARRPRSDHPSRGLPPHPRVVRQPARGHPRRHRRHSARCSRPATNHDFDAVIVVSACDRREQVATARGARRADRWRSARPPRRAVADRGKGRTRRLRDPDRRSPRPIAELSSGPNDASRCGC